MQKINLLDQTTIDKIAAGEVIERPASIVKELTENAIDAGANAVTVEVRDGGISLIRITDNGSGISKEDVRLAFQSHATSKIRSVEDLPLAETLGFRGEALSSIAAVAKVELITKETGGLTGIRYVIEGGAEKEMEEIGAPDGTTFLVRDMFFNTPVRKKFLKSAQTEAGYIGDLMERLALSHPEISFKFMSDGKIRMHTSGNGKRKDVIYALYGRDVTANLLFIEGAVFEKNGIRIEGMIGKPSVSRGNRNYENYFVNRRFVKNNTITRAIEEAYKPFLMNHRYPFTVLEIRIDGTKLDANVHPTKLEVRFSDPMEVYESVYQTVRDTLAGKELIPEISLMDPKENEKKEKEKPAVRPPEPFETVRRNLEKPAPSGSTGGVRESSAVYGKREGSSSVYKALKMVTGNIRQETETFPKEPQILLREEKSPLKEPDSLPEIKKSPQKDPEIRVREPEKQEGSPESVPEQTSFPAVKLLDAASRPRHRIVGQIFETFWIVEFDDKMYIIDQHAAHEKVLYERLLRQMRESRVASQQLNPPLIVSLSLKEAELLEQYRTDFEKAGFEIEPFGGKSYAVRAVPENLYGLEDRDYFIEMLDSLNDLSSGPAAEGIHDRIATMACKAAVKGNSKMNPAEADALIGELLSLENPYNCPHGRPTIISMTHYELDKKFKRIV